MPRLRAGAGAGATTDRDRRLVCSETLALGRPDAPGPHDRHTNAGVSGYSLDQTLLRFEANDPPFGADIVLIGFMAENINRLVNVFRPFYTPGGTPLAKPRFRVCEDQLVLGRARPPAARSHSRRRCPPGAGAARRQALRRP